MPRKHKTSSRHIQKSYIILAVLLLLASVFGYFYIWKGEPLPPINGDDHGVTPPPPPPNFPFTLQNAQNYISLETYEGSGQAVHPDMLVFQNGFQGGLSSSYQYIMAFCPYPGGNDQYENPSVCVANSPSGPFVKDRIVNPLVPTPPPLGGQNAMNSDPDILYVGGTFYLYYRSMTVFDHEIWLKTSVDLVTWTSSQRTGITNLVSPTVVYDGNWRMWGVRDNPMRIVYYESSDGRTWSLRGDTNIREINGHTVWHIDVTKAGNEYWGLFLCGVSPSRAGYYALYFARSVDGVQWTTFATPLLAPISGNWDSGFLYRGSMVIEGNKIRIWYSAYGTNGWRFGYTDAFFG